MKEATGELNMTVVTVVAIAAVAAFFYAFVWPSVRASIDRNTNCANAICTNSCSSGLCNCTYVTQTGSTKAISCPAQNQSVTA